MQNSYALITGASSGLGEQFAHILASKGYHLLLLARREERLKSLADVLRETYHIEVICISLDLTQSSATETLLEHIKAHPVDILINNAGAGHYQNFHQAPLEKHQSLIALNITSLTELTHRFLDIRMPTKRRLYILNVGSIAGYVSIPFYTTYTASKAYVNHFSRALSRELSQTTVSVTGLYPGATNTEFNKASGLPEDRTTTLFSMSANRVANAGITAMFQGKIDVIPGLLNKTMVLFSHIIPEGLIRLILKKILKPPTNIDKVTS